MYSSSSKLWLTWDTPSVLSFYFFCIWGFPSNEFWDGPSVLVLTTWAIDSTRDNAYFVLSIKIKRIKKHNSKEENYHWRMMFLVLTPTIMLATKWWSKYEYTYFMQFNHIKVTSSFLTFDIFRKIEFRKEKVLLLGKFSEVVQLGRGKWMESIKI